MADIFDGYRLAEAWDEMFAASGKPRASYHGLVSVLQPMDSGELRFRADQLARVFTDRGVTYDYAGEERPFPLDLIPRVIDAMEWDLVARGVRQRVRALEAFLADAYGAGRAFDDGVVPWRLLYTSEKFRREVAGIIPLNGVRVHVAGIDLVRDEDGRFRVLEDNVRVPSGVSYVIENRLAMTRTFPYPRGYLQRDVGVSQRDWARAGRAAQGRGTPRAARVPAVHQGTGGAAAGTADHPAGDLRAGERGDRHAVLPVPVAGRLGTGRLAVGWRLRIEHTTRVMYARPVVNSLNEARMTPLTLPAQTTLEARVTVGRGVPVWTYNDYWGTFVSVFDLPDPHDDLVIRARATVETGAAVPLPDGERLSWPEIAGSAQGRPLEFLMPTRLTMVTPEVIATVLDDLRGLSPDETAEAISSRVRSRVTYMPGATGVLTDAQEAWDKGQGVCQDMAHITVALLRAAGLPARYVSGYLHADPAAEPGITVAGQGHAWVEYWTGSWAACDPTSGAPVGERHVVVARGRDYADVPPLKGIYHGPPDSTMEVTVEVTRLA